SLDALMAQTRGDNEGFFNDVKRFADKYGPLENDDFNAQLNHWWVAIVEFQKAVSAWSHAQKTGDFEKLIRALERRDKWALKRTGLGIEANVLLRNDERNNSARLCIKPRDLISAMYMQLALAIDGGVNLRSCVECRKWFALDAG